MDPGEDVQTRRMSRHRQSSKNAHTLSLLRSTKASRVKKVGVDLSLDNRHVSTEV